MQVHFELPRAPVLPECALTVGTFDGVHRGHQLLVARAREAAAQRGIPCAVLTFQEMPFCYFRPDECPKLLTLPAEKIEAFRATGIDHLFIVPFDASLAAQTAESFARDLKAHLGLRALLCGPDFALGRDRGGTVEALREIGRAAGFEVMPLEAKLLEGARPISSTRVRGAVESGDVALAARMLGRPFALTGGVVTGRQLGRTIGFPTLNLEVHPRKARPVRGVYAAHVVLDEDGQLRPAALNIGVRPTVSGTGETVEVHVIGATLDIAPHSVRIEFAARLRDERKFAGLGELKAQLARDITAAERELRLL